MEYRSLGRNGPKVSVIGYGAWAAGGSGWFYSLGKQDDADTVHAIHEAFDAGINLFDTAPVYGLGHSEEVLGRALKDRRDDVILATKCGRVWDNDGKVHNDGRYASILAQAEDSLRRLGTDVIDLYQMHMPDWEHKASIEETIYGMERLVQDGKVRYIGVSNYDVSMLQQAMNVRHVDSLQPHYSLLAREVESEVMPFCLQNGIGVLAYSPLEAGLLTGKYAPDTIFGPDDIRSQLPSHTGRLFLDALQKIEQLRAIANQLHCDVIHLALAYIVRNPAVTSALVGLRRSQYVKDALRAVAVAETMNDGIILEIQNLFPSSNKPIVPDAQQHEL